MTRGDRIDRAARIARLPLGQRTLVMGIVNVTPDSFSGDGIGVDDPVGKAVAQASRFLDDGADILDIGGESTRPGAQAVSESDELDRVLPVIAALRTRFPDTAISIDSYKAGVARASLAAGADMINDVWGGRADPGMLPLAVEAACPIVLMHNRSKPGHADLDRRLGGSYRAPDYGDFLADLAAEMKALADDALAAGVERASIWLDPGVGFGKTVAQNMAIIDRLDRIRALGYPVLLGTSRKSFIGKAMDLPADQRIEGTAATVSLGIARGADIVRVHDVRHMARAARMTDAMLAAGREIAGESMGA